MAVTRRTLWLLDQLRRAVGAQTDDTVRTLTRAWVTSWDALEGAWVQALADVVNIYATTGTWPPAWRLARLERLAAAHLSTAQALAALTTATQATTGAGIGEVVAATAAAEPAIMASQLPAAVAAAAVKQYAAAIAPSALEAIAVRARQQVTVLAWPLSTEATDAMRRALIVGVATGSHPRDVARDMLRQVQGAFNGGLSRATVIARTEMLDAYRATSAQVHQANENVLAGWQWIATLDARTCPSCWGMHGTVHPLSQPGPWDHQQGRCARIPKIKSWAELGIDAPEPMDLVPDAAQRFAALPAADQRRVMGPGRLALLQAGQISLADIPVRRETPAWRPSYVPRSVRDLQRIAGRRRRAA